MKPKNKPENTPATDTDVPSFHPNPETSSQYYRDKETGDWKISNPAGSMVYNYLTREDMDLD